MNNSAKIIVYGVMSIFAIAAPSLAAAQTFNYEVAVNASLDGADEKQTAPQPTSFSQDGASISPREPAPRFSSQVLNEISVQSMDIKSALTLVSEKSGLNIKWEDDIQGEVTIYLNNIEAFDALKMILDMNNLAYVVNNDIVEVITAEKYKQLYGKDFASRMQTQVITLNHAKGEDLKDILKQMATEGGQVIFNKGQQGGPDSLILMDTPERLTSMRVLIQEWDLPIETEIFKIRYGNARDIAGQVEKALTKDLGRIQLDERSNNLVVTDTHLKVEKIVELIERLDTEERKILLEARIIQIILNEEHMEGVDWEAIVSQYQKLGFIDHYYDEQSPKEAVLSFGIISNEDYTTLLDALDTVGDINNISNVSLVVNNNTKENIVMKSIQKLSFPKSPTETSMTSSEDIQLSITPTIGDDDVLSLWIKPRLYASSGQLNSLPAEHSDAINDSGQQAVTINVDDGSTVVVGGLFRKLTVESRRKIPLLGDLPILGFAFRGQGTSVKETEIIIFLTPKRIEAIIQK